MDITYLGHSSFRLRGKSAYVVTDPFDPEMVGFKFPKIEADLVIVSHDHPDHNKADLVRGKKMVISEPGEYEVMGVSVIGIPSFHDNKKGSIRGKNTIFVLEIDGLRIAHLGDLGHKLNEKQIGAIGEIDVLMVPVGGEYTIGSDVAVEVAQEIEPRLIVPMHYQTNGLDPKTFSNLEKVENFLKKIGISAEKTNKLTIRKGMIGDDQKVIVLERK